jgi:hypothetical protein
MQRTPRPKLTKEEKKELKKKKEQMQQLTTKSYDLFVRKTRIKHDNEIKQFPRWYVTIRTIIDFKTNPTTEKLNPDNDKAREMENITKDDLVRGDGMFYVLPKDLEAYQQMLSKHQQEMGEARRKAAQHLEQEANRLGIAV